MPDNKKSAIHFRYGKKADVAILYRPGNESFGYWTKISFPFVYCNVFYIFYKKKNRFRKLYLVALPVKKAFEQL